MSHLFFLNNKNDVGSLGQFMYSHTILVHLKDYASDVLNNPYIEIVLCSFKNIFFKYVTLFIFVNLNINLE